MAAAGYNGSSFSSELSSLIANKIGSPLNSYTTANAANIAKAVAELDKMGITKDSQVTDPAVKQWITNNSGNLPKDNDTFLKLLFNAYTLGKNAYPGAEPFGMTNKSGWLGGSSPVADSAFSSNVALGIKSFITSQFLTAAGQAK